MTREPSNRRSGPSILAIDPWVSSNRSNGRLHQVLSDEERAQLATIASVVRFKKRAEIYHSGQQARALFNIINGVVKVYSGDHTNHVVAFLFSGDLFGLSEEGIYANTVEAITPVTAYQLPTSALRGRLSKDDTSRSSNRTGRKRRQQICSPYNHRVTFRLSTYPACLDK
jgi:CRP-like cAMP-binding protein